MASKVLLNFCWLLLVVLNLSCASKISAQEAEPLSVEAGGWAVLAIERRPLRGQYELVLRHMKEGGGDEDVFVYSISRPAGNLNILACWLPKKPPQRCYFYDNDQKKFVAVAPEFLPNVSIERKRGEPVIVIRFSSLSRPQEGMRVEWSFKPSF